MPEQPNVFVLRASLVRAALEQRDGVLADGPGPLDAVGLRVALRREPAVPDELRVVLRRELAVPDERRVVLRRETVEQAGLRFDFRAPDALLDGSLELAWPGPARAEPAERAPALAPLDVQSPGRPRLGDGLPELCTWLPTDVAPLATQVSRLSQIARDSQRLHVRAVPERVPEPCARSV